MKYTLLSIHNFPQQSAWLYFLQQLYFYNENASLSSFKGSSRSAHGILVNTLAQDPLQEYYVTMTLKYHHSHPGTKADRLKQDFLLLKNFHEKEQVNDIFLKVYNLRQHDDRLTKVRRETKAQKQKENNYRSDGGNEIQN